ncbi:hypothetical protein [Streptomyces ardesiacus]|uniref:hypothetical protein n=1 Tax=Streptomyces ardesiacus TaxID=285564 RepID=UPI003F4A759C
MATKTRNAKQTAKKTTPRPRKTTTKARPTNTPVNTATTVDLRKPLPIRRRVFVGPMGAQEQAAIRAALASAAAQLPIPVRTWNGPTAHLADGTVITHTPAHAYTDQTPTFHATIRCPHGAIHAYTIHTAQELHRARQITALCDQTTDTAPQTPQPNPAVRALGDALTRAKNAAADTQPMSTKAIAAGLEARADTEAPKEHPQP